MIIYIILQQLFVYNHLLVHLLAIPTASAFTHLLMLENGGIWSLLGF